MQRLRTEAYLKLCVSPMYSMDQNALKLCFLNSRSLHRHIDDIRKDLNYSSSDITIFSETRFIPSDSNSMYAINGYNLFRNDSQSALNTRPYGGTALYSQIEFIPGYPYCHNSNGVEVTIMKVISFPHITIIGIYRSPKVPVRQMCAALSDILTLYSILLWETLILTGKMKQTGVLFIICL